jgi:DNA transposition AAA+ family ATPase
MKTDSLKPNPDLSRRPSRAGEHRAPAPPHAPFTQVDGQAPSTLMKEHHENGVLDEEIRRSLNAYRIENKLTNAQLGKQLGVGPTAVSSYLNNAPRGNWQLLQKRAADMLANAKRRRPTAELLPLRDTPTSRKVAAALDLIRETNDYALIYGDAGIGKSCGCTLYAMRNPSSVLITAAAWSKNIGGVQSALLDELGWAAWDKKIPLAMWLVGKFRGSSRLIIVDNAHRLTKQALSWLFDFHDTTGCPIALSGNPEIMEKIVPSDQSFSRIGVREEIKLDTIEEIEEFTRTLLSDMAPELISEIGAEAAERMAGQGHARALRKQISLTTKLLQSEQFKGQPRKAFAAAKTKLVTPDMVLGKGAK